jgi:hypothetical protein
VKVTELVWIGLCVPYDSLWVGGGDPERVVALRIKEAMSGVSVSIMSILRYSRIERD